MRKKFRQLRAASKIKRITQAELKQPMTFEHFGKVYRLEFSRFIGESATDEYPRYSSLPSTTVRLWQLDFLERENGDIAHGWTIYRMATVGCYHRDNFTREDGRKAAITAMCRGLGAKHVLYEVRESGRTFRRAVWDAYFGRFRP